MCEMRWQPWGEGCGVGPTGMRTRHADVHAAPLSASCNRLQDRHGRSAAWTAKGLEPQKRLFKNGMAAQMKVEMDKFWGRYARETERTGQAPTLTGWLAKVVDPPPPPKCVRYFTT